MRVGIDFGTTTCTIGRIRADGRRTVHGPIPSVGAWRNGTLVFGDEARKLILSDDLSVHPIRDLKLSLGLRDVRIGPHTFPSIDFAEGLLRHLLQRLGNSEETEEAIIGTPVKMPHSHRVALREAAIRAGIGSVRFVYEPTAALIGAARFERIGTEDHVLVVDWGGGTLDVSVVRHKDDVFRELAVGGDLHQFGGTRIDEALARGILSRSPESALA